LSDLKLAIRRCYKLEDREEFEQVTAALELLNVHYVVEKGYTRLLTSAVGEYHPDDVMEPHWRVDVYCDRFLDEDLERLG
jgi:hypothetical protein